MSAIIESFSDLRRIADEIENCKSILQLEDYYKNNFTGKKGEVSSNGILQAMFKEKYKQLNGEKSRWVSGPRPTIKYTEKR